MAYRRSYSRNYYQMNRERILENRRNNRALQRQRNFDGNRLLRPAYKSAVSGSVNFFQPEIFNLGSISMECAFCKAVHFGSEIKSNCCHSGKLCNLPFPGEDFPEDLKQLFLGTGRNNQNFRNFIRQYNNSNAFTSMGARIQELGRGVYTFKIQGEVYHRSLNGIPMDVNLLSGNITPNNTSSISYAETFIYDTNTAVNIRMSNPANSSCNREIMTTISTVLHQVSPYAHSYRRLREVFEEETARANRENRQVPNISLIFTRNLQDDQRVYNPPSTIDDVALIYVSDREGNIPAQLDFAVYPSETRTIKRLNPLSKHLDPMIFPLFFPKGHFGWTTNMLHNENYTTRVRNKVTALQFYSYQIAVRRNMFNPLHYGGKLFQQYLVYAYARVETTRLNFIRMNQRHLRVESYQGLLDHLASFEQSNNYQVGNLYILPSSYIGGPRFMRKLYQDNMVIVRKFGRPDLFITFTCNPAWLEIKSELLPFQNPSDRPDLVTRVFNLKLKEFLKDMTKHHIFGTVLSYVYTIEHQKRGLPHAHCLFTLSLNDKFRVPEDVDNIISAEIPCKNTYPTLHDIVIKHNIHGPCGTLNPNCVCMVDGKCSKNFPKSYCDTTDITVDNFPKYRRRRPNNIDSFSVIQSNVEVDNRFVVPYNPFLSQKYNAHINVELCSTVKAIKYLHKYITKGHDYARIAVQSESDYDEIREYLNCRYLSSQEAAWHLQELPIHGQSHNIVTLSIHLEGGQQIFFQENAVEGALRRESASRTMLTAYFELNTADVNAHQFFYQDIPNRYIFKDRKWVRRSERSYHGEKTIGRIASVSPRNSELYHLRLILLAVKGQEAISFSSLKSFQGIVYLTYKEAARARGLVNDSSEWQNCLSEASLYMLPNALRSLFIILLCHCNPTNPTFLFDEFKSHLIEDFIHQGYSEEVACSMCLRSLKDQCEDAGFNFSLLLPLPNLPDLLAINAEIHPTANEQETDLWSSLNSDQLAVASNIMQALQGQNSQNYFYIDGPGGSGKTFLYRALLQKCNILGKKVLCVAWTGIAANLLPEAMTCHAAFSLPLNLDSVTFPKLSKKKRDFLTLIDLLIWDEAPMAPGIALEIVDLIFRDLMKSEIPFGGKIVVLGGDFRQVLPVIRGGNRISVTNSTIKKSFLWTHFKIFKLATNMRAINDLNFSQWLLKVGDGTASCPESIRITLNSIIIPSTYFSENIVSDIFGESFSAHDSSTISCRAILSPKNNNVRQLNEDILQLLTGEMVSFNSIDTVKVDDSAEDYESAVNFPVEYLNTLNPSGFPPHSLNLKKGAIVMLLRNLSIKNGLCNGTRLIIRDFRLNVLKAEIITGAHKGTIHFLPRITLDTVNDPALPFNFSRHQFPVCLAYAMTINKAQGQSFEKVGLFLPQTCFTHGQLYTGLSRATNSETLKIQILNGTKQKVVEGDIITENIVYPEVFSYVNTPSM